MTTNFAQKANEIQQIIDSDLEYAAMARQLTTAIERNWPDASFGWGEGPDGGLTCNVNLKVSDTRIADVNWYRGNDVRIGFVDI